MAYILLHFVIILACFSSAVLLSFDYQNGLIADLMAFICACFVVIQKPTQTFFWKGHP